VVRAANEIDVVANVETQPQGTKIRFDIPARIEGAAYVVFAQVSMLLVNDPKVPGTLPRLKWMKSPFTVRKIRTGPWVSIFGPSNPQSRCTLDLAVVMVPIAESVNSSVNACSKS
jgi:hypothetical protein